MSRKDVHDCLNSVGIKNVHMAWPENSAPSLPWAVFYSDGVRGVYADNTVFAEHENWIIEFYQRTCDPELEESLKDAILRDFGTYRISEETWLEDDKCFMTTFHFDQIG